MNQEKLTEQTENQQENQPTPLRCLIGAVMSGGLGFVAYKLMVSIATTFANKPVTSDNPMVVSLSSAVRTLVVGVVALGTGIFGIVGLGLLALAVQLVIKQLTTKDEQEV
ncbi:DUF3082 domain-containing protein [Plectonema cf. radiosum LEGE 06105]|uniref:DUF3082 domain-containing protein n=1 Tax=Plectonema cf. radiosum LEGE 06105 TaxID=945769 RepID=A0A8J7FD65_9CYAN|nr:DUF3082 domain-containing protein [Plectonema radiosum]MBE9212096.1 DUF3082 domain-containing protein [Plectonema cf. radiosum LEGE 06105]